MGWSTVRSGTGLRQTSFGEIIAVMSEDQTPFLHDRDFADMLAKTCSELALLHERFRSRPSKLARPADPAGAARALLAERRLRDSMFPKGLFGEPARELLLTLYVARADGEELNVTKACKLTGTPLRHNESVAGADEQRRPDPAPAVPPEKLVYAR